MTILETAVQVGLGGLEHIWITHYLDAIPSGTGLPKNLLIVKGEERIVKDNGTETRCKYNLERYFGKFAKVYVAKFSNSIDSREISFKLLFTINKCQTILVYYSSNLML